MTKLAGGVYAETSFKGVNVGALVSPDGVVCIDTPTSPVDCRKWRLKLAQMGGQPIQYVINLDQHRDRTLGNQWFEAPVIAHEVTGDRLRALPEAYRADPQDTNPDFALAAEMKGVRIVPPQLTFTKQMTLAKGGRQMHLLHRPGPAAGAIWAHLPAEKILFAGDSVVGEGVVPIIGEADLEVWLEHLAEIRRAKFAADVIVPGRGPLTDKDGVKRLMTFLKMAQRKIERAAARRGPAESAALAPELLQGFTVSAAEREQVTRRFKIGLDRLIEAARGNAGQ